MVTYRRTNVTSKMGINFVRAVVEETGCLFHKIDQENDLGIDALIELTRDERPLHKQVAAQVKSGQSYYNTKAEECLIPIEHHREYWSAYPLPVIGIVYVPSLKRAHWVDIKYYLKAYPTATVIGFATSEANRLDAETFQKLFLPTLLREVPDISLERALTLFRSLKPDESYLGLIVLFRRYPNSREAWELIVSHFLATPPERIPPILIYYLAHIPWHPDIAYSGEGIAKETREYVNGLLRRFGRAEILKLLGFIDTENMISRGSIGQSVEALISSLPHLDRVLEEIARDHSCALFIRECAALILAMHIDKAAKPVLQQLADSGSWYARELGNHIDQFGGVNPYA